MRINIWIVLATLLALLAVTRYLPHRGDTQRVCVDDPTASVCHRFDACRRYRVNPAC